MIHATVATMVIGMLILRTGRGPLELAITALLHARAAGRLLRVAVGAAWGTRGRYGECLAAVKREV